MKEIEMDDMVDIEGDELSDDTLVYAGEALQRGADIAVGVLLPSGEYSEGEQFTCAAVLAYAAMVANGYSRDEALQSILVWTTEKGRASRGLHVEWVNSEGVH
jgi:hypothetical protein